MLKNNVWSAVLMLAFSFISSSLVAQTQTFSDIKSIKIRNIGVIAGKKGVNGYYSFYQLGKSDGLNIKYMLNILDENLNILSSKTITSMDDIVLREVVFNGENLLVKIQDNNSRTYDYTMYDKNAEEIFKQSCQMGVPYEYLTGNGNDEMDSQYLFPIEGKGFVNFTLKTKNGTTFTKSSYIIHYFGNDKSTWEYKSDPEVKEFELAAFLGEENGVLLALVSKRKGLMSKDIEEYILGLDTKTGTKLFENKIEDDKFASAIVNATFDETKKHFVLHGFFFEKDAKTAKAKSLGLSAFEMTEKGDIINRKYNTWAGDFGNFLPTDANGKIEDVGYLFFHKFVQTADGKTYGIAEQYKKSFTGTSTVVKTGDIYIVEFDKDYNIASIKICDKAKSNVPLNGYALLSTRQLGLYIKYTGGFDYLYTQISQDKSELNIGYMDYEKGSKANKGWTYGSINYIDGKFGVDKIKMNTKADMFSVYPAKQGYVMIFEYFLNEKKMELRLEKLN